MWRNDLMNQFVLQELGILLGGLSDCEELVGVTDRGRWGGLTEKGSYQIYTYSQIKWFKDRDFYWIGSIRFRV